MSNPNTDSTIKILTVTPNPSVPGTATLTYNAGTTPANNGNVKETVNQGKVQITYISTAEGWTVCGCTVIGTVPSDMDLDLKCVNGANALLITDSAKDPQQLNFLIQVQNAQGEVYTSQDPAVINESH